MKRKILTFTLVLLLVFGAVLSVSAKEAKTLVSPGLSVIAADSDMAKSGLCSSEICFERDDFARALNTSKLTSITVTELPPRSEGALYVGKTQIGEGQTVTGSNISLMRFVASEGYRGDSAFTFSPNGSGYEIECKVYMIDKMNYAPTLSLASELALNVSTYKNVTRFGTLSAYDPDGDECIFEIVSYPKGRLELMNDRTGEYKYTPLAGFVGKDTFRYVAKDKYGNFSASAEVVLDVERSTLSLGFSDMQDSSAHVAAIALTEESIMSGTKLGDGYYFQPELSVSRAEFVVMAMKAIGIDGVSSATKTVFADDSEIGEEMKGYISAAYELGYVKGSLVDGKLCFKPTDEISRAEAAVIVGRMIRASAPTVAPVLADRENIPAWAESSVLSLASLGMLDTENGEVRAQDMMTRADAAKLLCPLVKS